MNGPPDGGAGPVTSGPPQGPHRRRDDENLGLIVADSRAGGNHQGEVVVVQCSYAGDPERKSVYTQTEEKLVRLGLDPAARGNEVDNSAVAFFRSLRKRA